MQAVSLAALIVSSHSLVLAVLALFNRRGNRQANRVLFTVLLLEALRLLAFFLAVEFRDFAASPWVNLVMMRPLVGPLVLLYVYIIINGAYRPRLHHFIHLVPFVIVLWGFPSEMTQPGELRQKAIAGWLGPLTGVIFLVYGFWALHLLREAQKDIDSNIATQSKMYRIATWLCIYFILSGLIYVAVYFLGLLQSQPVGALVLSALVSSIVFCYVVTFILFRQTSDAIEQLALDVAGQTLTAQSEPDAASNVAVPSVESVADDVEDDQASKYSHSSLTLEDAQHFFQTIETIIRDESLYLRHGLKLSDLADRTGLHVPQVSQVINQCAGLCFRDYINRYRINAACDRLSSGKSPESILQLAEEVGFNSSTSFYKYFKKETGMTPKKYLQSLPGASTSEPG